MNKKKETKPSEERFQDVGLAEKDMAMEGPAVFSNRVFVAGSEAGVRLTFTEQHSKESSPVFRVAAYLSHKDAAGLQRTLERVLKRLDEGSEENDRSSEENA